MGSFCSASSIKSRFNLLRSKLSLRVFICYCYLLCTIGYKFSRNCSCCFVLSVGTRCCRVILNVSVLLSSFNHLCMPVPQEGCLSTYLPSPSSRLCLLPSVRLMIGAEFSLLFWSSFSLWHALCIRVSRVGLSVFLPF